MIEIKLLSNRRFIYANRKHSIVITAENKATKINVLFPDEYEEYSKRVDFVNSQGKRVVMFWLKKICKDNNLPQVTLHSLRHTNITLQIMAGVPLVIVSGRAGHARTSTTT